MGSRGMCGCLHCGLRLRHDGLVGTQETAGLLAWIWPPQRYGWRRCSPRSSLGTVLYRQLGAHHLERTAEQRHSAVSTLIFRRGRVLRSATVLQRSANTDQRQRHPGLWQSHHHWRATSTVCRVGCLQSCGAGRTGIKCQSSCDPVCSHRSATGRWTQLNCGLKLLSNNLNDLVHKISNNVMQ